MIPNPRISTQDWLQADVASVLESLPLSVIVLRRDGVLCHANAPARRLAHVIHSNTEDGLARLTAGSPFAASSMRPAAANRASWPRSPTASTIPGARFCAI